MQETESEALRSQRKRRKRIGRIKTGIVTIIAGWIIISMILIIFLLCKTVSLEHKMDQLLRGSQTAAVSSADADGNPPAGETVDSEVCGTEQEEADELPLVSGMDEEGNLAAPGDVHTVYLTFDDGPSENTEAILDILAEYDVKATFFVVGKDDEESEALYRRIVEEGHTLGMHSYSNKYSVIYQSLDAFEQDYQKLRDYLYEVTGVESMFYRFPGGSSNQISNVPMANFIYYLNGQGITYFDWNVSAGDAAAAYTAEELVANVMGDVEKYKVSVVLLHDSADKETTVEALGPLIEALQAMDAQILPIDEDTPAIQYLKAKDEK